MDQRKHAARGCCRKSPYYTVCTEIITKLISKFHFARLTLQTRAFSSLALSYPFTPLSSHVPRPASPVPRPVLARSSPGLAQPSPTLVSSNLASSFRHCRRQNGRMRNLLNLICWEFSPVMFRSNITKLIIGDYSSGSSLLSHGEVRVCRGTGVSRRVRRTTWERSLKKWELQIPCFEDFFFWGGNTLGLVPASLPHALGRACTFYAPTSPPPNCKILFTKFRSGFHRIGERQGVFGNGPENKIIELTRLNKIPVMIRSRVAG